jgi:hypothetical protein
LVGKKADRLFRVPSWPVSYWTVDVNANRVLVLESRQPHEFEEDRARTINARKEAGPRPTEE